MDREKREDVSGACSFPSEQEAQRVDSIRAQVYAELRGKRYPMKAINLIANLGLPNTEATKSNLRQILYRAEKNGDVHVCQRGLYMWRDW